VTAFFIPGIAGDRAVESEYGRMRRQIELETGRRPSPHRILSIWTRRGSTDCVTQVGEPDPLQGGMVRAIFDLGTRQPFIIWREESPGDGEGIREVLGSSAYSVVGFDG
jgi:hypothetical protein